MSNLKNTNSRRRGLGLMEVLVVIGIIALSMAILMPVLASVRESSKSARCMSNQRQLGAEAIDRATTSKGMLPKFLDTDKAFTREILTCPGDATPDTLPQWIFDGDVSSDERVAFSYPMSQEFANKQIMLDSLADASSAMYFYDGVLTAGKSSGGGKKSFDATSGSDPAHDHTDTGDGVKGVIHHQVPSTPGKAGISFDVSISLDAIKAHIAHGDDTSTLRIEFGSGSTHQFMQDTFVRRHFGYSKGNILMLDGHAESVESLDQDVFAFSDTTIGSTTTTTGSPAGNTGSGSPAGPKKETGNKK